MTQLTLQTSFGTRIIGPGHPTFIIAEMSGNHQHSLDKAKQIIDAAADAGVDAIKLQTYTADTLTIDCDSPDFQIKVNKSWSGKTLYKLYQEAYTPWEWHKELKEYAESKGLICFSSPFDPTAVEFLETLSVSVYKVASFSLGHLPMLRAIGKTRKPVILSRGLSSIDEIQTAIDTLRAAGTEQIAILQCVSSYPATADQMNLRTIPDIAERFGVISGLSDHTLENKVPLLSIALGASIIEKHFTIARSEGGPDAEFSLEPAEMKDMVRQIREAEEALGKVTYDIGEKEAENKVFKQSLYAVADIEKGAVLTDKNIRIIRPGYGLAPQLYDQTLGKRAVCTIPRGTALRSDLFE